MANEQAFLSEEELTLRASAAALVLWVDNGGFANTQVVPPVVPHWGSLSGLMSQAAALIELDSIALAAESVAAAVASPAHSHTAVRAITEVANSADLVCRAALDLVARTERRFKAAVLRHVEASVKAGLLSAQQADEVRQAVAARIAVGATVAPEIHRLAESYTAAQKAAEQVADQAVRPEGYGSA